MIIYSDQEKSALVGVLLAIIYTDGFIDNKEMDYMGRIKYELNISDDLLIAGQKMNPDTILDTISAMDRARKQHAGEILMRLVCADAHQQSMEYKLAKGILLHCGIQTEEKHAENTLQPEPADMGL